MTNRAFTFSTRIALFVKVYTISIQMTDGGRGHATAVLVLLDGTIMGGDTHLYYTGGYTVKTANGEVIGPCCRSGPWSTVSA